jgi:hypothetical protein
MGNGWQRVYPHSDSMVTNKPLLNPAQFLTEHALDDTLPKTKQTFLYQLARGQEKDCT